MKLTKKKEAEILKVYKAYWDAYLSGDMKTFASMLDDDLTVFGTAVSEVFNNKKEALRFYKATADQMAGKAQFRNRKINVNEVDNHVLVNEQCDLYFLMDKKWTFYGHVRVSGILKHTKTGWKLVHQHGSFPDMRAEEGEQIAAEKIKAENLQLRDAVKRRTIELEEKNRELEIESAVERVRAKALAMHRSADLHEVVRVLRKELLGLNLDGVTAATIYLKQSDGSVRLWDLSGVEKTEGHFSLDIVFKVSELDPKLWIRKIWHSKKKYVVPEQGPEDFKRMLKWLAGHNKKVAEEIKEVIKVRKIKHGWHPTVDLGNGKLSTDFIKEPPPETEPILLKMAAAFDLAYKRFLDLKNAEGQAKEARIELALERVRARAMAMQNSNELAELVSTVFNELNHLDFALTSCIIWIHDHELSSDTLWIASSEMNKPAAPYKVKPFYNDFFKSIIPAWKAKDPKWVYPLSGTEKKNFEKAFFKELPDLPDALRKALKVPKQVVFSASFNNFGALEIVETKALTDEKFDILHRFGKVFDSSYTRFNDLKKAEAQAREAKIEASLERVRAKTMAMHKSSELLDVVKVLGEQFELLGFKFQSVNFDTDFQEKDWNLWLYNSGSAMYPGKIHIPYIDHPCFNRPLEAFKKGGDLHSFIFTKEEKDSLFDHIYANSVAKYGSDERKRFTYAAPGFALSIAVTKNTRITIANYYAEPFSEEENAILRRFANVFEQSYTRFLDLQKAEAQAREAEIELALERVRARTMAMQKSDELREAVLVIYEQLKLLHFESSACNIIIIDKESNSAQYWVSGFSQEIFPVSYTVPYFNHPYQDALLKPWKQGDKYVVYEYAGKMKQNFDEIFFTQTDFKNVPAEAKNVMMGLKSVMLSTAFMTYGALQSLGAESLSDENANILQRFAKVFEQTYTRFLDLQKAEAQAREAQIEAALERVRSRTMAMQKTDELLDAAELVHKELAALGINSMNVSYAFVDDEEKYGSYYSVNPVDGRILPIPFVFPHTETDVMRSILASWKKRESFNVIGLKEKATLKHQTYIGKHIQRQLAKINVPFSIEEFLSVSPKKAVLSTFNFANGYLFNIGEERLSKIQEELMLRFTRVFEQTYTRFLDLQKAEAQAREAQIEAALERVRSRTMGMQKSDELKEVIQVVYDQFVHLNIHVEHTGFIMDYKKRDDMHIWLADKHAVPFQVTIPYFDCAHWNSFREAKEKGIDFFTNQLSFKEKNKFYQDLFKLIPGVPEETLEYYFSCPGLAISTVLLDNVGLYIENFSGIPYTSEENNTLMRFGKVFQQTFTRFLDLQKAEAQAREAKIETVLERVRSRTMAMQKSDELTDVAGLLFEQVSALGIKTWTAGFNVWSEDNNSYVDYITSPQGGFIEPYTVYTDTAEALTDISNARKSGIEFDVQYVEGEKIKQLYLALTKLDEKQYEIMLEDGVHFPSHQYEHFVFGSKVSLMFITYEPVPEAHEIFKRLGKVFEQTYTRFLDLQKAEAQAREAQIELGLERVRARAMAMQNSDELKELIGTVFIELTKLDLVLTRCLIVIFDPKTNGSTWWMANSEAPSDPIGLYVKYHDHPPYLSYVKAWQERNLKWQYILEGKDKKEWDDFLFVETELSHLPDFVIAGMKAPDRVYLNASFNSFGNLTLASLEPLSNEHFDILLRFAKVFDLTYTRFNDLKQAEAQAREAQIELGLERVRARAMAMQRSDELSELVDTVFKELTKLDFALTWCIINIIDESSMSNTVWAANPDINKAPESYHMLFEDYPFHHAMMKGWKERRTKHIYVLEGQEKKIYDEYLFNETEFRRVPAAAQAASRAMEKYVVSFSFSNFGGLQTVGDVPLSDANLDILSRFGKVFDLTYTRFNDLKQAEAQARESQIQLAMERVRARTMAMQKSDELSETSFVLFQQFRELGSTASQMSIGIIHENDNFMELSATIDGNQLDYVINVSLDEPIVMKKLVTAWKEQKRSLVIDIYGVELRKYNEYRNSIGGKFKFETKEGDHWVVHIAFFSKGMLSFSSHERHPDETVQLLERFAAVFDLTYTRFLDLKNAEAQARESQIQLALERVRARTMAMQKSDELPQAANLLFQQVQSLGMPAWSAGYCTWDNDKKTSITLSMSSEGVLQPTLSMPLTKDPSLMHFREAWERGESFFVEEVGGEELKTHYAYLRTLPGVKETLDEIEAAGFPVPTFQIFHLAYFSKGFLLFITYEQVPEAHDIFKRFAKVFEQTYTRFLDLQKAEAQARESQIEAALERVRARAMAMHTSQELKDVALELRNQMGTMAQPELEVCAIHLYEESPDHFDAWAAIRPPGNEGNIIPLQARFPKRGVKIVDEMMKAYYDGKKDYILINEGEKLNEWLDQLKEQVPEGFKMVLESFLGIDAQDARTYWSMADFQGGSLVMTTYIPPNDDARKLLRRFSNVFGLAYRRFVDLKQAEAQAREAQIETALERVRSRSLAMHKSDELQDVVNTVFERLQDLNIDMDSCNIAIFKEGVRDYDYWVASPAQKRSASFYMPYVDLPPSRDLILARESGADFSGLSYPFEIKNEWFEHAFKNTDFKFLSEDRKKFILEAPGIMVAIAFSKHTGVQINRYSGKLLSEGEAEILKRFSKVFEQAYIRFLDLEKAEAQARESELELALERVRAKSMSMRHSDELADLVKIVFKELTRIGFSVNACIIMTYDERTNDSTWWISNFDGVSNPVGLFVPDHSNEPYLAYLNEWKKQTTKWRYKLGGVEKKKWDQYLFKNSGLATLPDEVKTAMQSAEEAYLNVCFNKYASITFGSFEPMSDKDFDTLHRFAKVFEQSYTRFLDLQKAEAQAREAQIETALERVRARTMGMHQSKELHDVIETITNQLLALGLKFDNSVFCRLHEDESWEMWMSTPEQSYPSVIHVPYLDHRIFNNLKEVKAKKIGFYTDVFDQDEARMFFKHFFENTVAKNVPEERKQYVLSRNGMARSLFLTKDIWFAVSRYSPDPFNDEENGILKRFAKVFEQSYIRFLDLVKAEAQAKEARIEIALERIRARALAMHKSDELMEVAKVMREQMALLGQADLEASAVHLYEEDPDNVLSWRAVTIGSDANREITYGHMAIPKNSCEFVQEWLTKFYSDLKEYTIELSGAKQQEWYEVLFKLAPEVINSMRQKHSMDEKRYYRFSKFSGGALLMIAKQEPSTEATYLQERAAVVFDLAYRRFSDLQKAEAQAREAQIEAALERVRAKAMAMHSSRDLAETLSVFYRELKSLSVIPIRCGVALMDKETRIAELTTMNTTGQDDSIEIIGKIKMAGHPVLDGVFENWLLQKEFHAVLRGNQIKEYYQVLKPQISYLDYSHDEVQFGYYFMFKEGDVYAWTEEELTEDELTIYRRFTTVISLTYKRYKDLQQAEAQAREAKIEAGLERVRARTMAMHSSEDVSMATATMFTELEKLGIENLRGGITIIKPDQTQEVWSITNLPDGRTIRAIGVFDMRLHPLWRALFKARENKEDYDYYWLAGKDKEDYITILNATPNYLAQPIKEIPDVHVQSYFFGEGGVWTNSLQPHSEEDKQIMKRFTLVFSLTFRRYQDLKKAEAQAREAIIEASLERVRGKAMAMHSSKDLATTIGVFYHELEGLNLTPRRCGVGLINKETKMAEISTMNASADGQGIELVGNLDLTSHPVLTGVYDNWLTKTEYHPVLRGNEIKEYYQLVRPQINFPDYPNDTVQYGYFFFFEEGGVYAWTEKELNEDELKIYRRFTSVLSLTYKRYKDLKDAEIRAQTAIKEAALDRIRAEIASMRTVNDLERITPLIWNELTILGIPFIRCGVFIMDEEQQLIHTFLSTPDGKAIAAFHLPYGTPGNLQHVVSNWKKKSKYIDHWDETEFIQFADILVKQGALVSSEIYLKTIPSGGFHLHFLPFLQGMLYVGNTDQLNHEQIELIQHVADAFSTAYARYEDFNKLEAAKQQVENTLTDLKQAQQQLVQSEKMASLGELTAGIAHEIQNPLNFVNNFSEVSKELLDEMKEELATGNGQQAMEIAEDIIQNLEKINHHGKRADAIVKSMLQHSRSSSGKKEPADINALTDEYLRLAFHGLRAKDKSFNAKFETEFDNSIGKINIISQDIGRVLVNLINNAFYAVSERKKQASNGYEPTVTVYTKKIDDKVEIKVRDNGNGIPQKVLEKIFQPFFTTKPTGQGTGLGLSLSYDIIKAHGGELKVETTENEGSEFVISLPG